MVRSLPDGFRSALVPLQLAFVPLEPTARHVFQMDLATAAPTGQRIAIWRGEHSNDSTVLDVDSRLRQLVLAVREPRRRFHHAIPKPSNADQPGAIDRLLDSGSRLARVTAESWVLESSTDGLDRRYLVGFDDDHLFIAHVAWGDRVRDAHEALKPSVVRDADLRKSGGVMRQGEWFFIPARPQERLHILRHPQAVHHDVELEPGARPHVVAEWTEQGDVEFARGLVTHADHRTVTLPAWHRVAKNAAIVEEPLPGLTWVD